MGERELAHQTKGGTRKIDEIYIRLFSSAGAEVSRRVQEGGWTALISKKR